jgi:hypothetical protein
MKNPKQPIIGEKMKQYVRVGDTVEMYCYEQHIKERLMNAVNKDGINMSDLAQINNVSQFGATVAELQKIGKEICRQYLFPSHMGTQYFGSYEKGNRDSEWALSYRTRQTNGNLSRLLNTNQLSLVTVRDIYEVFLPIYSFIGGVGGGEYYLKGNGFKDKQQQFEYIKYHLAQAVQYLELKLDLIQDFHFDTYLDEIEKHTANISLPHHIVKVTKQNGDFYPAYSYVGVCSLLGYFNNEADKEAVALEVCTTEAKCYMKCIYQKLLPRLIEIADSLYHQLSSYYIYYVAKLDYRCKRFIREEKYVVSKELVTKTENGYIFLYSKWDSNKSYEKQTENLVESVKDYLIQRYGATTKKWLARFKYISQSA